MSDQADSLERLAKLLDEGRITREAYERFKRNVLFEPSSPADIPETRQADTGVDATPGNPGPAPEVEERTAGEGRHASTPAANPPEVAPVPVDEPSVEPAVAEYDPINRMGARPDLTTLRQSSQSPTSTNRRLGGVMRVVTSSTSVTVILGVAVVLIIALWWWIAL